MWLTATHEHRPVCVLENALFGYSVEVACFCYIRTLIKSFGMVERCVTLGFNLKTRRDAWLLMTT